MIPIKDNYGIVVREFEFQSRYYVHFGKGINSLILPAMG